MRNDIPIIQKVYDFYREFYLNLPGMPKYDRHTIGLKMQNICLELLENLLSASRTNKQNKAEFLSKAAIKLDLLKTLLQLSEDIKALPTKRYLFLSEKLQEVGRMLGGWIKSLN